MRDKRFEKPMAEGVLDPVAHSKVRHQMNDQEEGVLPEIVISETTASV